MKKAKTGQVRIPSPFEVTATKTERTAVAILMHWMRQIIEKENLDLGLPDVDTSGADRKSPDTVIYESRRSQNVLCVLEAKCCQSAKWDTFRTEHFGIVRRREQAPSGPDCSLCGG